jgi:hypothetical protein
MDIKQYRGVAYAEAQPDMYLLLCPCGCSKMIELNYGGQDKYGETRLIDMLDGFSEKYEDVNCIAQIFHDETNRSASHLYGTS